MDHHQMDVAIKLLAKAQSTTYDAEALSLLRRSCLILTSVVATTDDEVNHETRCDTGGVLIGNRGSAPPLWPPEEDDATPHDGHFDVTA